MNRKFRVWDNEKKQMIYPDTKSKEWDYIELTLNGEICLYDDDDGQKSGLWEHSINFKKGRLVLEMFTGINGKNDEEIYEGDIVNVSMSFKNGVLPHIGEIVYVEEFGAFATKNLGGTTLLHNHCLHTIEIIGNVHQHPKLLEKSK